ncbi:MAG: hypothetical protein K2I96_12335 [Lachnospiraceae bacterium]|nr:hypothetical protein [Lachnospiraceae bacterium]
MKYLLTDAGAELLAKLGTTGMGLHLTRARTGAGYSDDPESLTELLDSQLEFQIAEAKRENSAAVLTLLVTNSGLVDEYRIQQIGIFALDEETGAEVLLIIGQDLNGDILPADSYGRVEYRYTVTIKISNALNVVIDINDTDFLLQKTFYECNSEGNITEAFYKVYTKVPKKEEAGTDAKTDN